MFSCQKDFNRSNIELHSLWLANGPTEFPCWVFFFFGVICLNEMWILTHVEWQNKWTTKKKTTKLHSFIHSCLTFLIEILIFCSAFLLQFNYRLDDHLIGAHHFRKDEYLCELCSKRFCYRPVLLKHRAIVHNEIRKYPCENCTKVS